MIAVFSIVPIPLPLLVVLILASLASIVPLLCTVFPQFPPLRWLEGMAGKGTFLTRWLSNVEWGSGSRCEGSLAAMVNLGFNKMEQKMEELQTMMLFREGVCGADEKEGMNEIRRLRNENKELQETVEGLMAWQQNAREKSKGSAHLEKRFKAAVQKEVQATTQISALKHKICELEEFKKQVMEGAEDCCPTCEQRVQQYWSSVLNGLSTI